MGQHADRNRRLVATLTTLFVAGSYAAWAQQSGFTEEKLRGSGTQGQVSSTARDVNASGVIVGDADLGAVFWAPRANGSYGNATALPSVGSTPFARGINDGGVIVGNDGGAVVWRPSGGSYAETFLAAAGLSEAWSVNAGGLIVGRDGAVAVIWQPNGAGGYVEAVLPTS